MANLPRHRPPARAAPARRHRQQAAERTGQASVLRLHVQVAGRRGQVAMPQQPLHGYHIDTRFEQMGRVTVPQRVQGDVLAQAQRPHVLGEVAVRRPRMKVFAAVAAGKQAARRPIRCQ